MRGSASFDEGVERVFLDANVIRGHLTTEVLLSIADRGVFMPHWSARVLNEAHEHRPKKTTAAKMRHRLDRMDTYFPDAAVTGFEHLESRMPAHPGDTHVLAAAVHSKCDVIVTQNTKHFHPPEDGPEHVEIETLSGFLVRRLERSQERVLLGLNDLLARNKQEPRTMPKLLLKMAAKEHPLRGFALELNNQVHAVESVNRQILLNAGRPRQQPTPRAGLER